MHSIDQFASLDEGTSVRPWVRSSVVSDKLTDAYQPGVQAEFDPIEAEQAGAFHEDALSDSDALDTVVDLVALLADPDHLTEAAVARRIAGPNSDLVPWFAIALSHAATQLPVGSSITPISLSGVIRTLPLSVAGLRARLLTVANAKVFHFAWVEDAYDSGRAGFVELEGGRHD